jgi:type I restriction enzyme R subunit
LTPVLDTESPLENATLDHFAPLGWECIQAEDEIDGDPTLLGRTHQGEVVLTRFLLPALQKLNPDLPDEAYEQAVNQLTLNRSAMTIVKANQDIYGLIKNGALVNYQDQDGNNTADRLKVIDWDNPENNHFLLVSQLWVNGDHHRRRPDLVGFVNGLPFMVMELKAPDVNVYNAFKENFRDYKDTIPHLFWCNGFIILSNGREAKVGSVTAPWEHFADWKKINTEGEKGVISLDTVVRATCEKSRILDIIENFTIFQEVPGGLVKIVAKNHQYLGVNNSINSVQEAKNNDGRLGVFWHTQGSGKSASMIFFTQKVLRKTPGNWTFVVVTDRKELDHQIYKTFQTSGIITEGHVQATSSTNLRQLLTEDHRYVFTLIHKFTTDEGQKHPVLSDRDDIVIITDEAHRSQYDIMAQNMRDALPNASFLGFTGTPLIKSEEEKTRAVFGDYVSIYDFRQSIEDGATVPLYYENRIPEVQLTKFGEDALNDEMNRIIDEAMLDDEQEKKLEQKFGKMYHIISNSDRLDKIAADIVEHFMGRGNYTGKAMYVSIDKATAVKMYDNVTVEWQKHLDDLKHQLQDAEGDELMVISEKIEFMEESDMAVVVSPGQNEVDDLRNKGVEILPHREKMNKEDLETRFKDPEDPFRIVFVCAMWMTGFDVPSCSTIYLDKPLRNHTLMQTIARANRVFEDKTNGIIVDYVGVFRDLERALAIYGGGNGDKEPIIKDKDELKSQLIQAIDEVKAYIGPLGVDLEVIRFEKDVFKRVALKNDAVEHILVDDDTKKEFTRKAELVRKIYRAYLPDPIEPEIGETAYLIRKLAKQIQSLGPVADVSEVMTKVDALLDQSIEGFEIVEPEEGWQQFDLTKIDFEGLRADMEERWKNGRKRTEIERFRNALEGKINKMIEVNKTRIDFRDKLQEIINDYNNPNVNLDDIFKKLIKLSEDLDDEDKRHVREELNNDQELAVFDLLTKPDMSLSQKEIKEVKGVARNLLETLTTEKMVLDWRKKQQTRAGVKLTIEQMLDQLPNPYDKKIYSQKCDAVYRYVYDLN